MSKIAILGDLHIAIKNASPVFFKHQKKFFDFFFDYLETKNIDTVFQLGDLFDNRKACNIRALKAAKEMIFDPMRDKKIRFHALVGNHDSTFRDNIHVNTPELVLREYENITIYSSPTTVTFENTTIDIIPWMCSDNTTSCINLISSSKSDLCLGHFELMSFDMYRGFTCTEGLSSDIFEKYEMVFSGHFHTKSQRDNIIYVGTPYELTWQDFNDQKGFFIFDTETRAIEFIANPDIIFVRIEYDADTTYQKFNIEDKFVKVVVLSKPDLFEFENFIKSLHNENPYEVRIIESTDSNIESTNTENVNLEDTLSVIQHFIDMSEIAADKEKLKTFMGGLYIEALNV